VFRGRVLALLKALLEMTSQVPEEFYRGIVGLTDKVPQKVMLAGLFGLSSAERGKQAFTIAWQALNT
jgi:hypothetical protein